MKFLLESAFVMSIANWIWGDDLDVSPELCVELFPLMNGPCWSKLLVKLVGIMIILGACMNKAPIILNILNAKSTEGMSRGSVYGEQILYANAFSYGLLSGHPITAFGENGALAIQNVVILLLTWQFSSGGVSLMERGAVILVLFLYLVVVMKFLTENMYYLLMTSMWPIMLYSKGSQIYASYQAKHMASQSVITTIMNVVGGLLRVVTTLKEIGFDIPALTIVFISLALNSIPLVQHYIYRKNTEAFLRKREAKKEA